MSLWVIECKTKRMRIWRCLRPADYGAKDAKEEARDLQYSADVTNSGWQYRAVEYVRKQEAANGR